MMQNELQCLLPLVFFGLLPGSHRPVLRGAPRGEHLSTRRECQRTHLNGPIRFPQHLFSVHDHGRQHSGGGRSTLSTLTLAWLYIEPSPCGGVRPAGDPVDSDPGAVFEDDPHPRSATSDQYCVSFQQILCHPHTQIRIVLFHDVHRDIPSLELFPTVFQ